MSKNKGLDTLFSLPCDRLQFGGKVCFFGGVDVQGSMIHGSPGELKKEVKLLIDLFGKFEGGYIGGTSHSIMPETPLDNVIALYEAFLAHRINRKAASKLTSVLARDKSSSVGG